MRKLSLTKLNLRSNNLLQKEQLKTVLGGYEDEGSCTADCPNGGPNGTGWSVTCHGSGCSAEDGWGCTSGSGIVNRC